MFDVKYMSQKIKELRKNEGFTRDDMAEILEISKFTYRNWELLEGIPSIEALIKLSNIFGVSIDEIVGNEADVEVINRAMEVRKRKMRKK